MIRYKSDKNCLKLTFEAVIIRRIESRFVLPAPVRVDKLTRTWSRDGCICSTRCRVPLLVVIVVILGGRGSAALVGGSGRGLDSTSTSIYIVRVENNINYINCMR